MPPRSAWTDENTLASGTFSIRAMVRSMSRKSCGVELSKVVNTRCTSALWFAWAITSPAAAMSGPISEDWRLSICILKPPPLPRPRTGGGGMTMTRASWMSEVAFSTSPVMTAALRPTSARSFAPLRVRNITPALVVLVKVAPSKPAMITALATPSTVRACLAARRHTSVVRSREEPDGSWTTPIR